MDTTAHINAAGRIVRYTAGAALALGIAIGSAGIAGAEPATTQVGERPVICDVVGGIPFVGQFAGCRDKRPSNPGNPGQPPTTVTTVPVRR